VLTCSDDSSNAGSLRTAQPSEYQRLLSTHVIGEKVSGTSARLRVVAALAGSLSDSLCLDEAAVLVEERALVALGATSAVILTFESSPPITQSAAAEDALRHETTLNVLHTLGGSAELKAAIQRLARDSSVPIAEVARTGKPLFFESERSLRRYPDWGVAMIRGGARAAAIVPVWGNDDLRGILGLSWPEPHVFGDDEQTFVLALGEMCAQAIIRSYLRAGECRARALAEDANRAKARALAMISHELRTPMNAVMGYAALLADGIDGPVNPLQINHLGRIRDAGKHLLELIDELLGYARIEVGEEMVRAERVLLADVVDQSLMFVRPIAEQKGLRLLVVGPDQPIALRADPRKLRQIVVNLLANAVKFSDAGNIVVTLRGEVRDLAARVCIEVTDTGRGIAPEDHEHVFDPFWQKDPTSPRTTGSTGLGLSIARQLARVLGGDVRVGRSAVGAGSTLVVSLPV
jgi:signal transduction histidine kinase